MLCSVTKRDAKKAKAETASSAKQGKEAAPVIDLTVSSEDEAGV